MKLITRDTDYAVRALIFITKQKEKIVSVSDLVKELKIPKPFLRKILQILNKHEILNSYKGKGGGFVLARSPKKIFLIGLMRIFQGSLKFNECFLKKKICPNIRKCILRKKIDRIEKYAINQLNSITINSLLNKKIIKIIK